MLVLGMLVGLCSHLHAQSVVSSNGSGGGDWSNSSSWDGGSSPGVNDTAYIVGGDSVYITVNKIVGGLEIAPGGVVYIDSHRMDIDGDYIVNGRHSGDVGGNIRLKVNNTYIGGSGTVAIAGEIEVQGPTNHVVDANAALVVTASQVRLTGACTLTNLGILELDAFLHIGSNSTIVNASGGLLLVNEIIGSGVLDADAIDNEVGYHGGAVVFYEPLTTYHHLRVSGTGSKEMFGDMTITGNITLLSATFDVTVNDYDLTVLGDWKDYGGGFNHGNAEVHFSSGDQQQINAYAMPTFNDVYVDGSGSLVLFGDVDVDGNLDISGNLIGGGLNSVLYLSGDWMNTGIFSPEQSTVNFDGSSVQSASGSTNWYNVQVENATTVELSSGSHNLRGSLMPNTGTFETNDLLTLASSADVTGRIATIPSAATVSGEITMERFVPSTLVNWRGFSSAVVDPTITDFSSTFLTTGFPGSDFPQWPTPQDPWPNIYSYDVNGVGPSIGDNLVGIDSAGVNMGAASGYMAFCGDVSGGNNFFMVDVTGIPNMGPQVANLQAMNTNNPAVDGFNLVGNPYPSPIDWLALDRTDLDLTYWIYNPEAGNVECFHPSSGNVFGLADGNIASSQGFWVRSTGSIALNFEETHKTDLSSPIFKAIADAGTRLEINIGSSFNDYTDRSILFFDSAGVDGYDAKDAYKMWFSHWDAPSLATVLPDGRDVMINTLPNNADLVVPIRIYVPYTGDYTISFGGLDSVQGACFLLEDTYTGTFTNLTQDTFYTATVYDTTIAPRFFLHFNPGGRIQAGIVTCAGYTDGIAIADAPGIGPFDYVWTDLGGDPVTSSFGVVGSDTIIGLAAGTYIVTMIDSSGLCGSVTDTFDVLAPLPVVADFVTADTVYLSQGGNAVLNNVSTGAVNFVWDFGDGSSTTFLVAPTHTYLDTGLYAIVLMANTGPCADTSEQNILVLQDFVGLEDLLDEGNLNMFFSQNSLEMDFYVDGAPTVNVAVLNLLGQTILRPESIQVAKGRHSLLLPHTMARGVYIVQIEYDGVVVARKLNY
jgi:PKD repeat protein